MKVQKLLLMTTIVLILGISACSPVLETPTVTANLANPASVFCEENQGKLEFRQDASGATYGMCVFTDGSECEEWAFFRGECKPGDSLDVSETTPTLEPAAVNSDWLVFENAELGYSFSYPANTTLDLSDEPRKSLTITGPVVNDQSWPVIYFVNPGEGQEYHPQVGVNLEQWLRDNNFLLETIKDDVQIAGVTTVHSRHERSPQSYASDTFYFVKAGKLFNVTFLHAGDLEDWDLYNAFLDGIKFD
jgi:putative hemolysin